MSTILKVVNNAWVTTGLCRLDPIILPGHCDVRARQRWSDLQLSGMARVWRIDLGACIPLSDRDEVAYPTRGRRPVDGKFQGVGHGTRFSQCTYLPTFDNPLIPPSPQKKKTSENLPDLSPPVLSPTRQIIIHVHFRTTILTPPPPERRSDPPKQTPSLPSPPRATSFHPTLPRPRPLIPKFPPNRTPPLQHPDPQRRHQPTQEPTTPPRRQRVPLHPAARFSSRRPRKRKRRRGSGAWLLEGWMRKMGKGTGGRAG